MVKRVSIVILLFGSLTLLLPLPAAAQWNWNFYTQSTPAMGVAALIAPTNTRTPTKTRTATRTKTETRTRTQTRTRTPTRTPTETRTPKPTFTETPFGYRAPTNTPGTGGVIFGSGQISMPQSTGSSPAQKLPAALLMYPLIQAQTTTEGVTQDTRIELVNLTNKTVQLNCFYVRGEDCFEVGFFVTLTPNQPISWLASTGYRSVQTFSSVPPFRGEGEMKCGVVPSTQFVRDHNAVQGRALVYDDQGQALSYNAVAFRRLVDGPFEGVYELDGQTYENCPDRLHFDILAQQTGSNSEIILMTCSQDLLNQQPSTFTAQFQVVNEFENVFSASMAVTCWSKKTLSRVSNVLTYGALGTTTAHLIVRGAQGSLVGLVLDRFEAFGVPVTTGNEPFLEGGKPGVVYFP